MKLFLYLSLCILGIQASCDSGYYRPFILLPCKPCQEEDVVYFGNNIKVRNKNLKQEMPFKKSEICLTYQISTLWKNQVMSSCIKNRNQKLSRILQRQRNSLKMKVDFGVVWVPKVTIILGVILRNPGLYRAFQMVVSLYLSRRNEWFISKKWRSNSKIVSTFKRTEKFVKSP